MVEGGVLLTEMFYYVLFVMLGVAVFLAMYRLLVGPRAADRAVALDALTNITAGLLVIMAFMFQRFIYMDVALVYTILAFVGVIAVARYLEGGI